MKKKNDKKKKKRKKFLAWPALWGIANLEEDRGSNRPGRGDCNSQRPLIGIRIKSQNYQKSIDDLLYDCSASVIQCPQNVTMK